MSWSKRGVTRLEMEICKACGLIGMPPEQFNRLGDWVYHAAEVNQVVCLRKLQALALNRLFNAIPTEDMTCSAFHLHITELILDILDTMLEFPVPWKTVKVSLQPTCPQHWRDLVDADPGARRAKHRWRRVRWAVRCRPYALHWIEEHAKAHYAPGGAGRKRDRDAFEAAFTARVAS